MLQLGPCVEGWSPAEIITAICAGVAVVQNGWLAYRRVRKDSIDDQRWSICPLLAEREAPASHSHSRGARLKK